MSDKGDSKKENSSENISKQESSAKNNIAQKINELEQKMEKLENENAVLSDKVASYEDPNNKPRVIQRGYTKPGIKFEKNKKKIKPVFEE